MSIGTFALTTALTEEVTVLQIVLVFAYIFVTVAVWTLFVGLAEALEWLEANAQALAKLGTNAQVPELKSLRRNLF